MPIMMPMLFRKLDWDPNSKKTDTEQTHGKLLTIAKSHFVDLQRRYILLQKCFELMIKHTKSKEVSVSMWECFSVCSIFN